MKRKGDSIDEIARLIKSFHEKMAKLLPGLEAEVDQLIHSQSKNEQLIEQHLDTLLSLTQAGMGEKLFIKLLEYAKTVNPDISADYWRYYQELDE